MRKKTKTEVDSHRLMFHPKRVSDWVEGKNIYPIYVEIGLTNRCNHRCSFCALDWVEKNKADMDSKIMLYTLDELPAYGVKSVMFAGEGEPLLHRDISQFVKYAKENGLDVSITTNGVLFNEKKAKEILPYLSWIRFSVDAGTKETYSKIHGTKEKDFEKVISNIEYAANLRDKKEYGATIGVQTLLMPENIDEIPKLARIAKKIGADNIQVKPYSQHPSSRNKHKLDFSSLSGLEKELQQFNDENFQVFYRVNAMKRLIEEVSYPECLGLPFFTLIDAKGNVIPCNLFYGNEEFYYGNLQKESFGRIWTGKKRKEVLEKIEEMGTEKCRRSCRLDRINIYLHELKNPHPHVNFI